MKIKVHSRDEYAKTDKGQTYSVHQNPSFNLSRTLDGGLALTIVVKEEEMKGTGEWGGEPGKSVKYMHRTGTVEFQHDELKELALVLHNALFASPPA